MRLNGASSARSAAAGIRLVDQLRERALEALEVEVKVEDLIDADRCDLQLRRARRLRRRVLDFLHRPACNREHNDEGHLALRARDLQPKTLILMAEDLHLAAFQAASTYRAVVKPGAVADELDDAHRSDPYYAPRLESEGTSDGPRCTCSRIRRRRLNAWSRPAAPCRLRASIRCADLRFRGRR